MSTHPSQDPSHEAEYTPVDDQELSLVELVRLDYDATLRALSGFVTTGGQIRAIGAAAWAVVLGLAVGNESSALSALAAALLVVFAYADAYHAALYRRALGRAITIESLLDGWIDRLGIDADDPDAVQRTRAKLEMHRFGVQRALRRPKVADLVAARPRVVFWAMYPAFFLTSIIALVVFA
jgi:hypothetical protein